MPKKNKKKKKRLELDFKGFKFEKILTLKERERVLDIYPYLQNYPELDPLKYSGIKIPFDKALRYVMFYYTRNALHDAFPEIAKRKKEAALLAGFKLSEATGRFSPRVEEMLNCENEKVNQLIIRFVRRSSNKKFTQLCVFEEARAKQMQKLLDGVGDKDKELTKVVMENVKTLTKDIEDLETDLLNEDTTVDLLELMYNEVDSSNLGISPEEIAHASKDGTIDEIIKSPYESD